MFDWSDDAVFRTWVCTGRCHVMEHESFEDEDTASVMNSLFVNIKVDREERPDVDKVYVRSITIYP